MRFNTRRGLFFLCFFTMAVSIFGYDGKMMESKSLKRLNTKYFEIIYPDESKVSASLLYKNADRIYEEVASNYGWEPHVNFPVVLCPSIQFYYSHYTGIPFKHLVMIDTAENIETSDYSNDFLSKFRIAITKAFIRTIWDKFWTFWGFDIGVLWITPGLEQAPAVINDNIQSEGFLHDEYLNHIVKQAVIENQFPAFSDVQFERYLYPYNAYIPFNMLFAKYLLDNYGLEKYTNFYYRMVNTKSLGVRLAFKEVYKMKLNDVWKEFSESLSYSVEESPAELVENNVNAKRYFNLQKTDRGIYYLDVTCKSVFFVPFLENSTELDIKNTKKLFMLEDIIGISVSSDGRFITASYESRIEPTEKMRLTVYDTVNRTWFKMKETGIYENAIFMDNGKYKIVTKGYEDQQYFTKIFDIVLTESHGKTSISDIVKSGTVSHPYLFYTSDYTAGPDGNFFCLSRENMNYSICMADSRGRLLKKIKMPLANEKNIEAMKIRNLNYSDGKLTFSWVQKGSMPRFGYYDLNKNEFYLDTKDYSGGVFFPLMIDESNIIYTGYFYKKNELLKLNLNDVGLQKYSSVAEYTEYESIDSRADPRLKAGSALMPNQVFETDINEGLSKSKKYEGFDYYRRFLFIPLSFATTETHTADYDVTYLNPWGISLFTTSPWTDGKFRFFAGYGVMTNSFAALAEYRGGTNTDAFKYKIKSSSEFDGRGWKQSDLKLSLNSKMPLSHGSSIGITFDSQILYGRKHALVTLFQNDIKNQNDPDQKVFDIASMHNYAQSEDNRNYLYHTDQLFLTYYFIKKVGNGTYKNAGFSVGSSLFYFLNMRTPENYEIQRNALEQGFELAVLTPGFAKNAPMSNIYTYDLPINFVFSLFPRDYTRAFGNKYSFSNIQNKFSGSTVIFSGFTEFILFAMEIQKAIPGIQALYVDNFKVSFTMYDILYDTSNKYSTYHLAHMGDYFSGQTPVNNSLFCGVRVKFGGAINFGTLTYNLRGDCFGEIVMDVQDYKDIIYNLGIELKY